MVLKNMRLSCKHFLMLANVQNRDKFFENLSENYKEVLDEFLKSDVEMMPYPWPSVPLYNILNIIENHLDKFPTISENLKYVDGYTIVSIGVSILNYTCKSSPHKDLHPTDGNFKRFHLPLQLTDTSFMYIQEDDGEYKKYSWELGKWSQFTAIDKTHYPLNEDKDGVDRILLMVDLFEGEVSDKDVYEYYEVIETLGARLNEFDFRPYYDKYIQNKT